MEALAPQQLLSLLHQRQLFVFAEERRKRVGCSAWPPAAHSLLDSINWLHSFFIHQLISSTRSISKSSEPELPSFRSFLHSIHPTSSSRSLRDSSPPHLLQFIFSKIENLNLKKIDWRSIKYCYNIFSFNPAKQSKLYFTSIHEKKSYFSLSELEVE